jgi:hypothetical protein
MKCPFIHHSSETLLGHRPRIKGVLPPNRRWTL